MDYLKNAEIHYDYIWKYCERNSFQCEEKILTENEYSKKYKNKLFFRYTTHKMFKEGLSEEKPVLMEDPEDLFFNEELMSNTIKRVY